MHLLERGFWTIPFQSCIAFNECILILSLCWTRDACVMYMGIFKKCKESGIWNENEWPLSDTTSLRNVPTSPELRRRESRDSDLWSDITSEAGDLRSHTRSPSKAGDYSSEFTRARGASSQASWDEGPESANGQPINTSLYSNGIGWWPISHSSQLPRLRHSLDASSIEPVTDLVDASNLGVHGQRHHRAWGPPPQYLAHQIPLAVKAKNGPLLSGTYTLRRGGLKSSNNSMNS